MTTKERENKKRTAESFRKTVVIFPERRTSLRGEDFQGKVPCRLQTEEIKSAKVRIFNFKKGEAEHYSPTKVPKGGLESTYSEKFVYRRRNRERTLQSRKVLSPRDSVQLKGEKLADLDRTSRRRPKEQKGLRGKKKKKGRGLRCQMAARRWKEKMWGRRELRTDGGEGRGQDT